MNIYQGKYGATIKSSDPIGVVVQHMDASYRLGALTMPEEGLVESGFCLLRNPDNSITAVSLAGKNVKALTIEQA